MRLLHVFRAVLLLLIGICPNAGMAEFSIRRIGPLVSANESLLDASRNGWILVRDNEDPASCEVRVKLGTKHKLRLCDKGLLGALRVNERGVVLGFADAKRRKPVLWDDQFGLRVLETLKDEDYSWVELTDLNNKDEVVGFFNQYKDREKGDTFNRAYRWRSNGTLSPIQGQKSWQASQALALNDKGQTLVWAATRGRSGAALYVGTTSFRRIDRRGDGIFVNGWSGFDNFDINNTGQIAVNGPALDFKYGVGIFSPRSGWKVLSDVDPCGRDSRCDLVRPQAKISNTGRALLSKADGPLLIEDDRPAVQVECLVPQNTEIGSGQYVRDIGFYEGHIARFLRNDEVLVSAQLSGDERLQLFLVTRTDSVNQNNAVRDFCPKLVLEEQQKCNSSALKQRSCIGKIWLSSVDGPLNDVKLQLYARQVTAEAECQPKLVQTLISSAEGATYSITTDPEFDYYFSVDDARFNRGDWQRQYLSTGSSIGSSPATTCRDPLRSSNANP